MYNNTYFNNYTYGSPCRPITFSVNTANINGVNSLILTSNLPFFDKLRYGCEPCSVCYAVICDCIQFGLTVPIYITDDDGATVIPLRTKGAGFTIQSDQIQEYGGSRRVIKLLNVYDNNLVNNNHINILSPICPKHITCNCETPASPSI